MTVHGVEEGGLALAVTQAIIPHCFQLGKEVHSARPYPQG